MRIWSLFCLWLCLALTASVLATPEDRSPGAVEIEVYCADLRPGDDSIHQACYCQEVVAGAVEANSSRVVGIEVALGFQFNERTAQRIGRV
jgi:hypothetical protein